MSNLTDDQVKHVAMLAKLNLTDEEIKKYQDQLSHILSHIDELSQVDTAGVEPTSQTTGLTNVFRQDAVVDKRILTANEVFLNAKNKVDNHFSVDAVIDKDSN
jgi:aspartyl-tRNA(Asn)/glutamyl-tRNA(Gln) amidotransferase subunit C